MGGEQSTAVKAFKPPGDSDDESTGGRGTARWKRRLSAVIGGGAASSNEARIGRPVSSRAGSADSRLAVVAARERQRGSPARPSDVTDAGSSNVTSRPVSRQYSYSAAVPRGRRTSIVTAAVCEEDGHKEHLKAMLSPDRYYPKGDNSQESTPPLSDNEQTGDETGRAGSGKSRTPLSGKSALPPLCAQTSNESAASARRLRRKLNITRGTLVTPILPQPTAAVAATKPAERPGSAKRPGGRWRTTKSGSLDSGLHKAVAAVQQPEPEQRQAPRQDIAEISRSRQHSETSSNGYEDYCDSDGKQSPADIGGKLAPINAPDLQLTDLE